MEQKQFLIIPFHEAHKIERLNDICKIEFVESSETSIMPIKSIQYCCDRIAQEMIRLDARVELRPKINKECYTEAFTAALVGYAIKTNSDPNKVDSGIRMDMYFCNLCGAKIEVNNVK